MIRIGIKKLTLDDFESILFKNEKIELEEKALIKVEESFEFLKGFSKDKLIYGINTGFGPMAQYKVDEENLLDLQYNLIRSHCAGMGEPLDDLKIKSAMICRLNSLIQGYSGVHPEVVILLKDLINNDVYPQIFEHGGVGASGDLVQLAHLALNLIGEGEVKYKGTFRPTAEVYNELGLKPISVHLREGLALINGTSVMTGIGMLNLILAERAINWSLASSMMIIEMVESYSDHYSTELNAVKPHIGQQAVAAAMQKSLGSSKLIRKREEHLFNKEITKQEVLKDKVQEYYSIRCIPQILGPILDTFLYAKTVIENEANSVNDNPIVDKENQNIWHGGNFHGDYVSLEMDKLKIALTKLSVLSERQLNFLFNRNLNGILPPFVNLGKLGLNLGMQAAQFTATSTTAENQTLSNPMYVHSISCNNDNQDVVSMGTNSALICNKVINNTLQVLSIELLSIAQAIDALEIEDKLSENSKKVFDEVRTLVPKFVEDSILHQKLNKIISFVQVNNPAII
ncbi:HAL/PAL/TAL family ammonia-lyase [Arcticibacterium luteifluviistationis]|uniref:Histidine ammonia-lyase n=1 Tax=Arcticibacterium luteifluviistationis TaxID=1784714 RepID=A0A2Z4GD65_9BACT|nr:aromatic amino acid ammonia-lyase [Arcticibacterium luteifluviistationis]AWV99176.1 histidine ammonia-lyase [Arcticibacterium luteifluviistationis]